MSDQSPDTEQIASPPSSEGRAVVHGSSWPGDVGGSREEGNAGQSEEEQGAPMVQFTPDQNTSPEFEWQPVSPDCPRSEKVDQALLAAKAHMKRRATMSSSRPTSRGGGITKSRPKRYNTIGATHSANHNTSHYRTPLTSIDQWTVDVGSGSGSQSTRDLDNSYQHCLDIVRGSPRASQRGISLRSQMDTLPRYDVPEHGYQEDIAMSDEES